MRNHWLIVAGVLGFLGVALGAVGAHMLEKSLSAENLARFETAVRYHLIHAVVLLLLSANGSPGRAVSFSRWAFLTGIVLFSGSLYLYATKDIKGFAHVLPFGGVALMSGWIALVVAGLQKRGPPLPADPK